MRLLFTFLVAFAFQTFGQNTISGINIILPSVPDANTANWNTGFSMLAITANAKMENGRVANDAEAARVLVFIRKNGIKACGTFNTGTAPLAGFTSAIKTWSGSQAISLLGEACTLAPGSYEVVVQFFGSKNGMTVALSEPKTKPFTINAMSIQAPVNIAPSNEQLFTQAALSAPLIFKWTPVSTAQTTPVKYRLKVWQFMVGQSTVQAMNANMPLVTKDVNAVTQTVVQHLISGPCLAPYLCKFIWTVQALNADGNPVGMNNGISSPTIFSMAPETPPASTGSTACTTLSTKNFVSGDEIKLSDGFVMQLNANPTGGNAALTGTGTVYVKWLGVLKVKFKAIKVNSDNRLCEGAVYTETDAGQDYPTQWTINVMNNTNIGAWTISKVHAVSDWIQGHKLTKPLVKATDQVNQALVPVPLSMPIGYFKDMDQNTAIGFTEMVFKPDHAEFEAVASLNTEKLFKETGMAQTNAVALRGSGIYFTGSGLSGAAGAIKLVEPLVISYANSGTENLKLTFNKEANGHIGNGIVFSPVPNQFWKYNLDFNIQLPKQWLLPADPAKTNVDVNFQSEITEWNNFVLQGNLPESIIPNTNGLGIEAGSITYDHSTISNAANMVFPAGYSGNTNAMFTGFYLKTFKLTLPDQLRSYADTTKKITVAAENLIIDKDGITGKILASNVLNYPKANVGNLGASIDEVSVVLNNSTLTTAKMEGKITLPLSNSDQAANGIRYSALFTPSAPGPGNTTVSSLIFTLNPDQDITSRFLGDGKIQISPTSSLSLILSKSTTNKRAIYLDVDLNGKLYYPAGNIMDIGSSVPLDLDLSCNFEHIGLHYIKATEETFTFQPGHWSFASPQKKLSGFAFTITDVKAKIDPVTGGSEKQYLFKGGVEFVAKINVGSENSSVNISGDTKIALTGAIESSKYTPPAGNVSGNAQLLNVAQAQSATLALGATTNVDTLTAAVKQDFGFLTQLKPKYLGVKVERIHIDATMPALSIKGDIDFYKKHPVYGNGFKGDLQAKFTTLNMAIQAGAIFGNTKYIPGNTGNGFKYWKVEAQVSIPPPGIVFLTGLAFRGFGAGVYSRMQMTPPATFNPAQANASTFGGAVFTPDATVKMGFKAKAIIATTPKEETFNGSVAIGAQFNSSGGINNIQIDGLFNCGAAIGQESKAFASGALNIAYDFPLKKFSTNLQINFNKDPVTTPYGPVNAHFYIDGIKNEWAFTSGYPSSNVNTLNTVRLFNKVDVSTYLMFGNKIPVPTGFMPRTINGFASIGKSLPTFSQTANSSTSKTGKGFAFGIGVYTDGKQDKKILGGKNWEAGIRASFDIGSEINASLLQYQNCAGFGDGWRIATGIAVYAKLTGKGYYKIAGISDEINLISLGFGAFAYAEFPNPFYAEGSFSGNVKIGKKISFGFNAEFKTGEKCAGTTVEAADVVYVQENAAEDLNKTLIQAIVTPAAGSGTSRTTSFAVQLSYPDNEEFSVEEQQSSGQLKVRTFRAVYTPSLIRDSVSVSSANVVTKTIALSSAVKQAGTATPTASNPNLVAVVSAGYDAVGARLYKLTKTGIQTNPLRSTTSYKFTISGRLEEKINNTWQPVRNPLTQQPIMQTKYVYFKTDNESTNVTTPVNHTASITSIALKKL